MKTKSIKLVTLLTAILLVIGMIPLASAAGYNVTLTKYESDWSTVSSRPVLYQTLKEAVDAVGDNEYAQITISASTDELTTITINQTGSEFRITGTSGAVLNAPITISGNSTVKLTNVTMNCSSTAIIISKGSLYLYSGTAVSGTQGVINNGGTVYFHGGQVSSYRQNSGSRDGTISLVGSATPTPYPTPTPTAGPHVYVTGIDGLPSAGQMNVGESYQLTPTVRPTNATNQSVTWKSSNTTIATVNSNGVVKANAVGVTTITVTTVEGGYTDSCRITVVAGSSPTATVTPTPTTSPTLTAEKQIAARTKLYLGGSIVAGTLSKSSTLLYVTPKTVNQTKTNIFSIDVETLNRLRETKYNALRYRLPWVLVDLYPRITTGMGSDETLEISVQRLTNTTMTSTMRTKWNSISSKSLSGPWQIVSTSEDEGMYLRIRMDKYYSKSNLRLVKWNGTNFVDAGTTTNWAVVKIGSYYYLRSGRVSAGTYALLKR